MARAEKQAICKLNMIRVSPRKLNLLAELIRGKNAAQAMSELSFSKRRSAKDVWKALNSAIANAENNHQMDVDKLYVAEATVGRAIVLKRFMAMARGRGVRIVKPFSNLRIVVKEVEEN